MGDVFADQAMGVSNSSQTALDSVIECDRLLHPIFLINNKQTQLIKFFLIKLQYKSLDAHENNFFGIWALHWPHYLASVHRPRRHLKFSATFRGQVENALRRVSGVPWQLCVGLRVEGRAAAGRIIPSPSQRRRTKLLLR